MKKDKLLLILSLILGVFLVVPLSLVAFAPDVFAAAGAPVMTVTDSATQNWAYISAALSAGLGALGAGYAVAVVGSAAVGALAEKPELLGRLLIIVGLAEGIAIYGLIVAILILNQGG
jgi:V/A-type H+-transporting ATPase subunit K